MTLDLVDVHGDRFETDAQGVQFAFITISAVNHFTPFLDVPLVGKYGEISPIALHVNLKFNQTVVKYLSSFLLLL